MTDDDASRIFSLVLCIPSRYTDYGPNENETKTANGVEVLRANIETNYGVVHIIDGLMDRPRLMDFCPSLRQRLSSPEGQQKQQQQQPVENVITNHSISLRKVSDQDMLASLQYDPSNEIDHNAFDVVVVPFPKETDSSPEAKYGRKTIFLRIFLFQQQKQTSTPNPESAYKNNGPSSD